MVDSVVNDGDLGLRFFLYLWGFVSWVTDLYFLSYELLAIISLNLKCVFYDFNSSDSISL